jgi:glycerol uptake facilitator protein
VSTHPAASLPWRECLAEAVGTYILVLFGVGAVHVAVLAGALHGLLQVAVVWGVAASLAIYVTAGVSGAHINPAITLAMAVWKGFPKSRVLPYVLAQLAGAFAAAATLYLVFGGYLRAFESEHNIVRGAEGSEHSAMVFGEYFPNPGMTDEAAAGAARVSHAQAMAAEGLGTMFLAIFVLALTDARNPARPPAFVAPVAIGVALTMLIIVVAPLTQAGFNPARDFGPRLFAWLAGWGSVAIPGPRGGFFTVYILSPVVGAIVGGGLYQIVLRRLLPRPSTATTEG